MWEPMAGLQGNSQAIAIPGLGGEMDAEILSLLVPATLAVFLDPAMALIDTGVPSITQRCYREGTHKLSGSDFLSAGAGHPRSPPVEILPWK